MRQLTDRESTGMCDNARAALGDAAFGAQHRLVPRKARKWLWLNRTNARTLYRHPLSGRRLSAKGLVPDAN
jgi:hypothetical protein